MEDPSRLYSLLVGRRIISATSLCLILSADLLVMLITLARFNSNWRSVMVYIFTISTSVLLLHSVVFSLESFAPTGLSTELKR